MKKSRQKSIGEVPEAPTQRFVRPGKDNGYFVTLPHNTAMLSDVYDVTENTSQ